MKNKVAMKSNMLPEGISKQAMSAKLVAKYHAEYFEGAKKYNKVSGIYHDLCDKHNGKLVATTAVIGLASAILFAPAVAILGVIATLSTGVRAFDKVKESLSYKAGRTMAIDIKNGSLLERYRESTPISKAKPSQTNVRFLILDNKNKPVSLMDKSAGKKFNEARIRQKNRILPLGNSKITSIKTFKKTNKF